LFNMSHHHFFGFWALLHSRSALYQSCIARRTGHFRRACLVRSLHTSD
jgi:hypothetical protein